MSEQGGTASEREQFRAKVEENRRRLYAVVKNVAPEAYERAVQIGHLAHPEFGGYDVERRCAAVEAAAMYLVATLLGLDR